jgi:hypothetical protein
LYSAVGRFASPYNITVAIVSKTIEETIGTSQTAEGIPTAAGMPTTVEMPTIGKASAGTSTASEMPETVHCYNS